MPDHLTPEQLDEIAAALERYGQFAKERWGAVAEQHFQTASLRRDQCDQIRVEFFGYMPALLSAARENQRLREAIKSAVSELTEYELPAPKLCARVADRLQAALYGAALAVDEGRTT